MILVDKSQYLLNDNQDFFQSYLRFRVLTIWVRLIYISSSLIEKKKGKKEKKASFVKVSVGFPT